MKRSYSVSFLQAFFIVSILMYTIAGCGGGGTGGAVQKFGSPTPTFGSPTPTFPSATPSGGVIGGCTISTSLSQPPINTPVTLTINGPSNQGFTLTIIYRTTTTQLTGTTNSSGTAFIPTTSGPDQNFIVTASVLFNNNTASCQVQWTTQSQSTTTTTTAGTTGNSITTTTGNITTGNTGTSATATSI
jgi:hypothetical protein